MICEFCGKKTATMHVKTVVNGKLTEYHLCDDCAREKGYGNWFSGWGLDFGDMLSGLLGSSRTEGVKRCEKCGTSFQEITKTGKIGCAECYNAFRNQLLPVIQRIHGTAQHKGKVPGGSALRIVEENNQIVPVQSNLDEKRRLLQKAIEVQDFEQAAILRDEIKELENNG